jgi:hypothetical protein
MELYLGPSDDYKPRAGDILMVKGYDYPRMKAFSGYPPFVSLCERHWRSWCELSVCCMDLETIMAGRNNP